MAWRYNFDANNYQLIFNATELSKIPLGQSIDREEGSELQNKPANKLKG